MSGKTWRRLRLASQITFFLLFVFLLLRTEFPGSVRSAGPDVRVPYPVALFLETDPLVALATALSTASLYRHLVWAVPLVLLALIVGRAFCGWICPLGSLHHAVGSLKSEKKRGLKLLESNRYKRWQSAKYYVLAVVLVMALFGSVAGLLLDPLSFLVRSMTAAVLPVLNYGLRASLDWAHQLPLGPARTGVDGAAIVLNATVLSFRQPYFHQAVAIGLLFTFVLALNLRVTRFWCRAICPLGAMLGVVSRWSMVQLEKHDARCNDCQRCELHCQGGDDPIPGATWRKAECHLCMNCLGDCPEGGLSFTWSSLPGKQTRETPQLQRRAVFTSLAAGAVALPLLRTGPGVKAAGDPLLIRPPGSVDEDHFLERCIRCGDCMKVCPNNALHPALFEAGVEGLWSPVLVPRIGYCEPNCTLCTQVCPTGAIWELTVADKIGSSARKNDDGTLLQPGREPNRIGTAFYDHGRCLPWAMGVECIVCEEWCPTTPKAIYLVSAQVTDATSQPKTVRQPYVEPRRCTGCGACEFACPIKGRPAVYVTSAGESRAKANQFLLPENQPLQRT
jgi:polyferredoxin